ncbi:IS1 family transposase [Leptolyngbya sp. BC1307]|uniref:IS1 family transposase n=1 Tax=Leptolyngbya sp. BC1307 TaxID=2029589 RepID=UPI000EFAC656
MTIQCDAAWSFVGNKGNKQWIWLAIDAAAGEIVGVFIGRRSRVGARGLWRSLPPIYRQWLSLRIEDQIKESTWLIIREFSNCRPKDEDSPPLFTSNRRADAAILSVLERERTASLCGYRSGQVRLRGH